MFIDPLPVFEGQILLPTIYAEYDGQDSVVIGISGISEPGETMLQDVDGLQPNGTPGDWYYSIFTPMLRLNFDPNAQEPVSVTENDKIKFSIYPNPNNGEFKLNLVSDKSSDFELSIHNILGEKVYNETLQPEGSTSKSINLSHLQKGIYSLTITDKTNKKHVEKIIIQ